MPTVIQSESKLLFSGVGGSRSVGMAMFRNKTFLLPRNLSTRLTRLKLGMGHEEDLKSLAVLTFILVCLVYVTSPAYTK